MRHSGGPNASLAGATNGVAVDERMNEGNDRKTRIGSGVGDRGFATVGVPAEHLVGKTDAAQGVHAHSQRHAARRHLKDVRAARCIEYVLPFEDSCERLAVRAVANETEARRRRNLARDAAHMAALAAEKEVYGHACHVSPVELS